MLCRDTYSFIALLDKLNDGLDTLRNVVSFTVYIHLGHKYMQYKYRSIYYKDGNLVLKDAIHDKYNRLCFQLIINSTNSIQFIHFFKCLFNTNYIVVDFNE